MEALRVQAAVHGQGAALVPEPLARAAIEAGQLVVLLDRPWPGQFAYYVVCPETTSDLPKITALREWLTSEGGGS